MANLNDRGQIILVAAFALGVIFIALAVVINGAIFTENLATRGEGTSDSDALHYRHEIEDSVGTVIDNINAQNENAGHGTLEVWAQNNITDISLQGSQQKAVNGRIVTVTYTGNKIDGTRFTNDTGTYTNETGNETWEVADGVSGTRGLTLNVTNQSALATSEDDGFTLALLGDSGDYWNMTVYEDSGDVNVTVRRGDGEAASCTQAVSDPFTIDVTAGTVAGKPCPALGVSDGREMWYGSEIVSPYTIYFNSSDKIEGGYEGTIDGSVNISSLPGGTTNSKDALYSVTVRYSYQTPSLRYETDIRVAPGEPGP